MPPRFGFGESQSDQRTRKCWTGSWFAGRKLDLPLAACFHETVQPDALWKGQLKHSAFSEDATLRGRAVQNSIRQDERRRDNESILCRETVQNGFRPGGSG